MWLYRILDWMLLVAPIAIYAMIALVDDKVIAAQKVALVGSVMVAIVLVMVNVIFQKKLRCPIWIILLGLYIAMKQYLLPLIVILAIVSVMDDLLFTPLIQHYKTALIANKEIDKREREKELDGERNS